MKRLLLWVSLLFAVTKTQAQNGEIIYWDYEPDSLVELKDNGLFPEQSLLIDMDDNGQPDITVYQTSNSGGWWFYVKSFSDWDFVSYRIDDTIFPMDEIDTWNTVIDWLPYHYQGHEVIDERFAVRHKVGNDCYYGWLRIYLLMNGTDWPWVALDKKTYCTVPNYSLYWGQTSIIGVDENVSGAFVTLHPNPTTGVVRIEGENAIEVQVYNALGQLVKTVQNTNEVSLEGQPQGIYLLRVTLEGGKVFSDKVVKE